jgi:hypothetical protein
MSPPLLIAYVRELPRLTAAESLRRAAEIGLGTGSLEQREARRLQSEWERETTGAPRRQRLESPAELHALMNAIGVQVVTESPDSAAKPSSDMEVT